MTDSKTVEAPSRSVISQRRRDWINALTTPVLSYASRRLISSEVDMRVDLLLAPAVLITPYIQWEAPETSCLNSLYGSALIAGLAGGTGALFIGRESFTGALGTALISGASLSASKLITLYLGDTEHHVKSKF